MLVWGKGPAITPTPSHDLVFLQSTERSQKRIRKGPVRSNLNAPHGHRMAKTGSRMGVDGNLRDLSRRELIGPLHFERRGSSLDFQTRRKIRRDQCGGNLLVDFHNALAKKVFN